jgi:hypothetical protein
MAGKERLTMSLPTLSAPSACFLIALPPFLSKPMKENEGLLLNAILFYCIF